MKIYDLSPEISEDMVIYKNRLDKRPKITITRTLKEGANESKLDIPLHTGSHVDAPYHILQNGKTIEKINLDKFMGKCIVLDFTKVKDSITKKNFLSNASERVQVNERARGELSHVTELTRSRVTKNFFLKNHIVLLKTKNKPDKTFNFEFTYLEKSGAEYLALKMIKAVGIDSLGIERNQSNHETHKIFARNDIPIFEGLDLSKVKEGKYFFYGLPLKIRNGNGSPVRAILMK